MATATQPVTERPSGWEVVIVWMPRGQRRAIQALARHRHLTPTTLVDFALKESTHQALMYQAGPRQPAEAEQRAVFDEAARPDSEAERVVVSLRAEWIPRIVRFAAPRGIDFSRAFGVLFRQYVARLGPEATNLVEDVGHRASREPVRSGVAVELDPARLAPPVERARWMPNSRDSDDLQAMMTIKHGPRRGRGFERRAPAGRREFV